MQERHIPPSSVNVQRRTQVVHSNWTISPASITTQQKTQTSTSLSQLVITQSILSIYLQPHC